MSYAGVHSCRRKQSWHHPLGYGKSLGTKPRLFLRMSLIWPRLWSLSLQTGREGWSCLASGSWGSRLLYRGRIHPCPSALGSEKTEPSSKGEQVCAAPLRLYIPLSCAVTSRSLHHPQGWLSHGRAVTSTFSFQRRISPLVPCRGPGTAEPILTESDDRLHLQHGVSQAGVPPLHQALLVSHCTVQALFPVLGHKEF